MENEKDYSSFIQRGEDGNVTSFDENKFSSFMDALINEKVNKGIDNYKTKVAKEQEMAKMSSDEKYNQMLKDLEIKEKEIEARQAEWETQRKSQMRDIVVEKAKSKLSDKFSQTEIDLLIQNVTDDEKTSLKYIDKLVEERTKFLEESEKKLIEKLQSNQPPVSVKSNSINDINQQPAMKRTKQDIKNLYK